MRPFLQESTVAWWTDEIWLTQISGEAAPPPCKLKYCMNHHTKEGASHNAPSIPSGALRSFDHQCVDEASELAAHLLVVFHGRRRSLRRLQLSCTTLTHTVLIILLYVLLFAVAVIVVVIIVVVIIVVILVAALAAVGASGRLTICSRLFAALITVVTGLLGSLLGCSKSGESAHA